QRQNLERLALEQEKIKEQQRQNLEQLALEQEKIRQEREKEIARQEQEQRERLFFLQQAEEKEKAHIQILKEMKEISEKIPSLMKSPLGDSQEFLKQIQKLFPKPEKKQANFFKKEEEKKPLKNSAPEKKLEIPFPVQKELFPEISLEDVCQKLHSVYSELRILEKHHAIKIHLLRRELNFPRETFDQAIKTLASQRKIDLVPADEENFERDERRDAYYDAIEDRTYYFIQWR
ncbi:MAG: hypothetical protein HUU50_07955, partial [Candidatus Brocadiae bacterium]|nr:hypothetical protein [Candidatus Brocadiia bacterium]